MGAISWVNSVTGYQGGGTSFSSTLPTGLANNDGVFALVMANSALTAPAGWTQIATSACTGSSTTQTLYLYRKNTVSSSDSGTSVGWTQASDLAAGVTYFAVRATSGVVVVHSVSSLQYNGGSFGTAEAIPSVTASYSTMVCVTAATTILTGGTVNPTAPIGTTKFTATSSTNYRLAASRASLVESDNITGSWTMIADTADNGMNTMSILLRDQQEQASAGDVISMNPDIETSTTGTYGTELTDNLGLHALLGILYQDELLDTVATSSPATQIAPLRETLAEALQLIAVSPVGAWGKTAAENVGLNPEVVALRGEILREGLGLDDAALCNQRIGALLADAFEAVTTITAGRPMAVSEALGLALTVRAAAAVAVVQELGLAETIAPIAKYHLTVSQGLGVTDELTRFLGGGIAETVGVAATQAEQMRFVQTLAEGLGVDETVAPQFILRVTASDTIGLSSAELLQQVLSGQIEEGLELSGAYVGPDGSFTTWTMNTRTGAVSEYNNYEFNSFARVGNKYLGASPSGLYELLGENDAGTTVAATLRGAYMQFAGTRLSRLKAAYIAATGAGTMVLKIQTKDGAEYIYSAATRDGRSTKVHMGKGQRSRYFAWELTTAGQDFDLDTLEFVPVRMDRRV